MKTREAYTGTWATTRIHFYECLANVNVLPLFKYWTMDDL